MAEHTAVTDTTDTTSTSVTTDSSSQGMSTECTVDEVSGLDEHLKASARRRLYLFVACAALNSCNLGFDIGVSSAVGLEVQHCMGLSDEQAELFMGWINLCAMIGSLAASLLSDWMGRRRAFAVAAVSFVIGVVVMASAGSFEVLMVGRSFVGLGVGFGLAVDPVYIAEIAPPEDRGRLVTWSEIATNIGIMLGFVCGAVFSRFDEAIAWRLMLGMGAFLPLVMLLLVWLVMPESPRWLIQKGRLGEAEMVLRMLGETDLEAALERMQRALEEEAAANESVGWQTLLCPGPALRRMLIVGIGVAVSQQLSGIDGIQYFLIYILKESGLESREERFRWLVALGALKLACIFLAGYTFDRSGRRPMLILSCAGMVVALALLSLNFSLAGSDGGHSIPALAISALGLYFAFFSFGMGPGAWLLPSEVFSQEIRAKAMSLATFSNRIAATGLSMTFLSLANALGYAGICMVLAVVNVGLIGFIWAFVPETKGRPLEEMFALFCELTQDKSLGHPLSAVQIELVDGDPQVLPWGQM